MFRYGPTGRPEVEQPGADGLQFNLSHSGEYAVYALTRRVRVGIDLEYIQPVPDLLAVARRSLPPTEYQHLIRLEPAARLVTFYACWTRKEAYAKATGAGLALEDGVPSNAWSALSLPAPAGYAAALVVEGHDVQTETYGWQ